MIISIGKIRAGERYNLHKNNFFHKEKRVARLVEFDSYLKFLEVGEKNLRVMFSGKYSSWKIKFLKFS